MSCIPGPMRVEGASNCMCIHVHVYAYMYTHRLRSVPKCLNMGKLTDDCADTYIHVHVHVYTLYSVTLSLNVNEDFRVRTAVDTEL